MSYQNIKGCIKNLLAQGKSKEQIYTYLIKRGVTVDDIQKHFNSVITQKQKENTSKKTIRIILTLGAILLGTGIFSFIAANWPYMSKVVKLFFIIVVMLLSYTIGWYLKEKRGLLKTGHSFLLLGTIIYGAGIFLTAQMFHIRTNWPDGFILWMIGSIFLAYAIESYPIYYLSIVLGIITVAGYPSEISTGIENDTFLLTSSFLLLFAAIVTFTLGVIIRKKIPPEVKNFY